MGNKTKLDNTGQWLKGIFYSENSEDVFHLPTFKF